MNTLYFTFIQSHAMLLNGLVFRKNIHTNTYEVRTSNKPKKLPNLSDKCKR